jgi:hemerythrin-like domain-containing protein
MHEHRMIERMLRILIGVSEKIEAGGAVDVELFEKAIDFIRTFADRFHHMKEEGELFPLIERKGIPKEGGPIAMMLHEHDIGRDYVRGMEEALRRYEAGDQNQARAITLNAMGYANLLSQHIRKEDEILYPMGNRLLTETDRKVLTDRFEEIEKKDIGEGVQEIYHQLIDDLETKTRLA